MSFKHLAFTAALVANIALAQTNQLEVSNAWARATPDKAENGIAYLTILSPAPDRLISVSSPVAKKAELHTMEMAGMVMKMRPLAGLDIPAGKPVTLKPDGIHIMLLGLEQPLRVGETFPLTVNFEKTGPYAVTVTIEGPGFRGPGTSAR